MELIKQILTIIISISFGSVFYILIKINKRILFETKILIRIISNFIFILDMTLIYFLIMKYINNGVVTYYSYLLIILGILLTETLLTKIKTYKK